MRKVFGIILAALVAVSAGGSFASAAGYVNQADIDIITASDKAYTDFIKSTNDEKPTAWYLFELQLRHRHSEMLPIIIFLPS